jgi:glycosyltransferase involved in cell wall biosynthesis
MNNSLKQNSHPLVTIVVVTFNCANLIDDTLLSIVNQDYPRIDLVVVDGGSSDGTVNIIEKYKDKINSYISEPDNGIYDAMNKGISLSCGAWINFMNAGDSFASKNSVSKFAIEFDVNYAMIASQVILTGVGDEKIITPNPISNWRLLKSVCHQSIFHNTLYLERYETTFRLCSDFDLQCKLYKKLGPYHLKVIEMPLVKYLTGGASEINYLQRLDERAMIIKSHFSGIVKIINLLNNFRIKYSLLNQRVEQ